MASQETDHWIQGSIKHPGRTTNFLEKKFGSAAFNEDGTIKPAYLNKGIKLAKSNSLKKALNEAKTLKNIGQ